MPPVDVLGNILALPLKLLLWSWEFDLHYISPNTEEKLVEYINTQHLPAFKDAKFQLNEYNPGQDLVRLVHNRHVAWPYRLLIGLPVTLLSDVLLPGRLFPWGDYYNPYNNTVHLFSDHPAIALHEAGHTHDFSARRWKGTYALCRIIPGVDLYQEYKATKEAIHYLRVTQDHDTELNAYKILYPAYGTYVGAYIFPPIGTVAGALLGHATGRSEVALRSKYYSEQDQKMRDAITTPAVVSPPQPATHNQEPVPAVP